MGVLCVAMYVYFFPSWAQIILLSFLICCFEFNTASYSEVKMKGVQDMLFFFLLLKRLSCQL